MVSSDAFVSKSHAAMTINHQPGLREKIIVFILSFPRSSGWWRSRSSSACWALLLFSINGQAPQRHASSRSRTQLTACNRGTSYFWLPAAAFK